MGSVTGTVRVATRRSRDEERVEGSLALEPGEGVVVLLDTLPG